MMDRREFMTSYKNTSTYQGLLMDDEPVPPPASNLTIYTGPWTDVEVIHLLKRTMFGSKKADIDYFKSKTMDQAVNELLSPTAPLPSPPVKEYDITGALTQPDTNIAAGSTWVNDANNDGTIQSKRRSSFKKWWMGSIINQDRSVREKMTMFWHNHFSTESNIVGNAQFVYKHHAFLRANALGNFKNLVRAVTIDPAMLVYLNGQYNTASAPDENYGRELQELFCCGKGTNSLYTESDVKAAAKVLTGWRTDPANIASSFTASKHDTTNKVFSAFYNNTTITGRSGATAGDLELDALLTMIFNTPEVSKYICRRLYRYFVYYKIDSVLEANVIEPLAAILRANNFEIKPVLDALFKSEHFYDALNQGCYIKSPVDLIAGMCRELNLKFPPATDYISNYGLWNYFVVSASNMQQNIGDPPDVSGWKPFYQEPQFYEIWINSDTLPKRVQLTDQMITFGYTFNNKQIVIDGTELTRLLSNPSNPNQLIEDALQIMFRTSISPQSKNQLKTDILLGGQANDAYWTDAWNVFISNPGNTANTTIVKTRLRDLYKYLMNLAEYQLA